MERNRGPAQGLPLEPQLLEEYKLCQQKATANSDNVWKSAVVLGAGSVAGIGLFLTGNPPLLVAYPWIVVILSLFAIGLLLAWHRFADRWTSIAQAMYRRMEHLERTSLLRANLYIRHLDEPGTLTESSDRATFDHPLLESVMLSDLGKLTSEHQVRGLRPMTTFIVEMNIAAWILIALFAIASTLANYLAPIPRSPIGWVLAVIFFLFFLCRLAVHWREK